MTMIIKVPKHKTEELKGMIKEGLHIFGRAMSLAEDMCEDSEMGERGGFGMRDMDYPYGDRFGMREDYDRMNEHHYPPMSPYGERWEAYGDRRGVKGTGRYSRY